MHARVVTSQLERDKIDQAIALYQQQLPVIQDQQGYAGGLLLTDQASGKAITIGLWETEASLLAGKTALQKRIVAYADCLAAEPVVDVCEVTIRQLTGGEAQAARVTLSQAQPGKMDEAVRRVRESILPAALQQSGCRGMLQLIEPATSKALAVTLWETAAAMRASEQSGYYREQLAKVGDLLAGEPTRETYAVAAQIRPPIHHAFAMPILPGQTEACRRLVAEWMTPNAPHRREFDEMQQRAGITHEAYWLQTGPGGDVLIVASDSDQREFTELLATATSPAALLFREQAKSVFGIDPAQMSATPEPELLVDWRLA